MIHQEPNWANHLRMYRDRVNGGGCMVVSVTPYADMFARADIWFDEVRDIWRVTVFDKSGRIVGKDDEYETKSEAVDTVIGYIDSGRLPAARVFTKDEKSWFDIKVSR